MFVSVDLVFFFPRAFRDWRGLFSTCGGFCHGELPARALAPEERSPWLGFPIFIQTVRRGGPEEI